MVQRAGISTSPCECRGIAGESAGVQFAKCHPATKAANGPVARKRAIENRARKRPSARGVRRIARESAVGHHRTGGLTPNPTSRSLAIGIAGSLSGTVSQSKTYQRRTIREVNAPNCNAV